MPNQVKKRSKRKGLLCWNLLVGKRFLERIWSHWKFICRESSGSKKFFSFFLLWNSFWKGSDFVEAFLVEGQFAGEIWSCWKFFYIFPYKFPAFRNDITFFLSIFLKQRLRVACTIKGFSYMGQVSTLNENVFHSVYGLTRWLLLFFNLKIALA